MSARHQWERDQEVVEHTDEDGESFAVNQATGTRTTLGHARAQEGQAAARAEAVRGAAGEGAGDSGASAFDPENPEATTLADLPDALEGLPDEEVRTARANDSRTGADAHYDAVLDDDE